MHTAIPQPRTFAASRSAAAPDGKATLILDLAGRIRLCSDMAGRLLECNPEGMIGQSITDLFPELPLRADTPGYNLAYVVFRFPATGWYRLRGSDDAGRERALDVSIDTLMMEGKRCLVLVLRNAAASDLGTPA